MFQIFTAEEGQKMYYQTTSHQSTKFYISQKGIVKLYIIHHYIGISMIYLILMMKIDVDFLLNLGVFSIFNNFLHSWVDESCSSSEKHQNYEDGPKICFIEQCVWNSDSLNTKKCQYYFLVCSFSYFRKIRIVKKRSTW